MQVVKRDLETLEEEGKIWWIETIEDADWTASDLWRTCRGGPGDSTGMRSSDYSHRCHFM